MSRLRASAPPIETPIIVGVLFEVVFDPTDGVVEAWGEVIDGGDEEDVDTSLFPSVDSGRCRNCFALSAINMSGETTSRYAHAGTAVSELI